MARALAATRVGRGRVADHVPVPQQLRQHIGETRVSVRKLRVEPDRLAEELHGRTLLGLLLLVQQLPSAQVVFVGLQIESAAPLQQPRLTLEQTDLERGDYVSRDVFLHREDVPQLAIVRFGP